MVFFAVTYCRLQDVNVLVLHPCHAFILCLTKRDSYQCRIGNNPRYLKMNKDVCFFLPFQPPSYQGPFGIPKYKEVLIVLKACRSRYEDIQHDII